MDHRLLQWAFESLSNIPCNFFGLQKGAGAEVQHGLCVVPLLFLQREPGRTAAYASGGRGLWPAVLSREQSGAWALCLANIGPASRATRLCPGRQGLSTQLPQPPCPGWGRQCHLSASRSVVADVPLLSKALLTRPRYHSCCGIELPILFQKSPQTSEGLQLLDSATRSSFFGLSLFVRSFLVSIYFSRILF